MDFLSRYLLFVNKGAAFLPPHGVRRREQTQMSILSLLLKRYHHRGTFGKRLHGYLIVYFINFQKQSTVIWHDTNEV